VPYNPKASLYDQPPEDPWKEYATHLYFEEVNLARDFTSKYFNLPQAPSECNSVIKEALMMLNVVRHDPEYAITHIITPLKQRFFQD
jgi:hypothetical protein